jgi:hypothetical protein
MQTLAIDLDDTLNDFSETLLRTRFPFDPSYGLSEETFAAYLARVRAQAVDPSQLLATDYSFFRYRIHAECFRLARPRADGIALLQKLAARGGRIVVCTYRDLRRAGPCTREWLAAHGVPYDHLFMAWNKIAFCRLWGIRHLVDDDLFNIEYGARHGVSVYYPRLPKHEGVEPNGARGFSSFSEIEPWILA